MCVPCKRCTAGCLGAKSGTVRAHFGGNYSLEVSSPGMDRSLFTIEQYAAYTGEWAEIKLRHAFEGRKNFKGVLGGIEDENVIVAVDGVEFLLPIESVEKGRVIPNFK